MTRFFYTDPLAAAWMAKHFGMKLLAETDYDGLVNAGARFIDCDDTFRELWQHDFSYLGKLYVHPDSLNVLTPKSGDCGWFHTLGLARIIRVTEQAIFTDVDGDPQKGQTPDSLFRIFMRLMPCEPYQTARGEVNRRFLEFHWPESEAE
jgi:hypothetical protein